MYTDLKYPAKTICLVFFLFFISTFQHASAAEKFKIAINDLEALGVPKNIALSISDILRTELFNTGSFHVTERSQMNKILDEQKFQLSGATEEDIIALGKLLSVQMMALGSINRLGSLIIINVRLVDIEEGRVRIAESEKARGEEQLPEAINRLANKMANSIPIQGRVLALENNKVIVSLGGSDGVLNGSVFRVQRLGNSYIDPVSKKNIGRAKLDIALMRVDEVMGESLSSASVIDKQKKVLIGDLVTISDESVSRSNNPAAETLVEPMNVAINSSTDNNKTTGVNKRIKQLDENQTVKILLNEPVNLSRIGKAKFAKNGNFDRYNWRCDVKAKSKDLNQIPRGTIFEIEEPTYDVDNGGTIYVFYSKFKANGVIDEIVCSIDGDAYGPTERLTRDQILEVLGPRFSRTN